MAELRKSIFSGMQILIDLAWVSNHAVVVENGLIKAVIPEEMIAHHLPAKKIHFSAQHKLIPGLIDLHVHGAMNQDVMDGTPLALNTISKALAAEGVTGFLATTMTAPVDRLEAVLKTVAACIGEEEGAAILGVHLEGPFISEAKKGAQFGETLNPDVSVITKLQKNSNDLIKIITLAPELPGAIEFIKDMHERNITVSIGHTNADYTKTQTAIQAGVTYATHLFNAMPTMHQREPGAACALLLAESVLAEIIVDGIHLHPGMVRLAWQVKEKNRLVLISDAMRAKCLKAGQYELGGQLVNVENGKATLADGTLAGTTLKLPQAIKNMQAYTSCSLIEAIYMASRTPAHVLNLETHKGTITVGKDADLVVMDEEFEPVLTMRGGKVCYPRETEG